MPTLKLVMWNRTDRWAGCVRGVSHTLFFLDLDSIALKSLVLLVTNITNSGIEVFISSPGLRPSLARSGLGALRLWPQA